MNALDAAADAGVFRSIDLAGFASAVLRDQPAPSLQWVSIADLVIDDRYQRSITMAGRRAIQCIADGWDWTKFQPVLIAATADGRFAVVDGQHRVHAAALVGLSALPAMLQPMTPVQQALAFAAINTSGLRPTKAALFRARVAAGDPVAIEAARLCEEAGCTLMTYNASASVKRIGQIFSHTLILRMVANGEGDAVRVGLAAIRQSVSGALGFEAGDSVYGNSVLKPWLSAVARSQRFLSLPLADIFDEIDWDQVRDAARSWARLNGGSSSAQMTDRVTAILRRAQSDRVAA